LLLLGSVDARAATYGITFEPPSPVAGQDVTFHAVRTNPGSGQPDSFVWDFGDGTTDTGSDPVHVYADGGTYTVTLSAVEGGTPSPQDTITVRVQPKPNTPPSAAFSFNPADPVEGDVVSFTGGSDPDGDAITREWDFGDGTAVETAAAPTHVYTADGGYIVSLTVTDEHGTSATTFQSVTVLPNQPPSASFSFTPGAPVVGQAVSFTGGGDPDGDALAWSWNFGDGTAIDHATAPSHSYGGAGSYVASLTVTDEHGASSTTFQTVDVKVPPVQLPLGVTPQDDGANVAPDGEARPPERMRPFPVVRIAGVVLEHGARVRLLSIRGPRGVQVRVRCHGPGCPARSLKLTSRSRVVRLHRFEGTLRAGTVLELFIRRAGAIGKYTRFLIRGGEAPARVDRCLLPGRARPVRCA